MGSKKCVSTGSGAASGSAVSNGIGSINAGASAAKDSSTLPAAESTGAGSAAKMSAGAIGRSEEHTSELQSRQYLVCRLLLEKKKKIVKEVQALKKETPSLNRKRDET